MTRLLKLTATTLLAMAPLVASAQGVFIDPDALNPADLLIDPPRLIEIEIPTPGPGLQVRGTGAAQAADNTPFCGIHDVFYWYEEDANGNEIPGTRQYGCTD